MSKTVVIDDGRNFALFLNKIALGKVIEETVLSFDKEDGTISARNTTQARTMASVCNMYIGEKKISDSFSVGISGLDKVVKYIKENTPIKLTYKDNKLHISKKGSRGTLRLQGIAEEEVTTTLAEEVDIAQVIKGRVGFEVKVDELLEHMSLSDSSFTVLTVSKGRVYAEAPSVDKVQYKVLIGKVKYRTKKQRADLEGSKGGMVYAKPFESLLTITKGTPIHAYISFTESNSIILEQENNFWAIGMSPVE